MSKKVLSILLAVVMVISIVPIATFAEEDITSYLTYEINNGKVTITGCDTSISGDVTIPETIEGYPVTEIGSYAFENCTNLTSVTIPDSVTVIGFCFAFSGCTGLANINLPDSLIEIGYNTFQNTAYYNNENNWDNGVLYIGKYLIDADENITECTIRDDTIMIGTKAFSECHNLKSIVIPGNVKTIGWGAFGDHLESLTQVTISEGVTTIGESAFFGAPIKEIVIPSTVTSIGAQAFNLCTELTDITILSENITNISMWAFRESAYWNDESNWEDGVLYIGKYLIETNEDFNATEYTVKDGTVLIGWQAFENRDTLEKIVIADSVKYFDRWIFINCDNLKSVILPENLEKCESPFLGCKALTFAGIIFPKGLQIIPSNLVAGMEVGAVTDIVLPESVKIIEEEAFYQNLSLNSIALSENVEFIGKNAFTDCVFLDDITLYNKDIVLEKNSIGYSAIIVNGDKKEFLSLLMDLNSGNYDVEKFEELRAKFLSMYTIYDEPQPDPNFTIYGYKGSTAETYANENNLKFVPICEHNYIDTVITPATYSQPGKGGEVCEHCGDVKSTYEIPCFEIEDSVEEEDKDTGVSVIFPDGAFDDAKVEIEVTPVEEGDAYKLISHKQGNYKVTMFDISITADGEKIQPNGTVLVKIPLPRGYNQNKCVVYYVADDGTMEELKTYHYKDGYVYFETKHFSYYAVIEDVAEEEETDFFSSIKNFFASIKAFFENFINILKNFLGIVA